MKSRAGEVLNGKYEVERQLAKGGMGSVWIARDLKLGRRVAVKFIEIMPSAGGSSAAIRARFEREAMAVARLNTPHVVQIFDHALDSDVPYIVMECLEGEDLKQLLAREQRLPFGAAVGVMNQAARGLRAAHEAGIVHRDLKPANIFLAEIDHEEVVKILDFGIAKLLDHRAVTVDGEIFGSAKYMSPEQISGAKDLDLRSDLWSMGVILYRAITGSDPFPGDIVKTVQSLRIGAFPQATTVAPDLAPEVDAFFARALALDKRRRFLSAVEMAEAFADLADKHGATTTGVRVARIKQLAAEHPATATIIQAEPPTHIEGAPRTARIEPAPSPPPEDDLPASGPVPRDQETLSATTRDDSPARQPMRPRWSVLALAVLGVAAAAFALLSKLAPAAHEAPTPAATTSIEAAAPPADTGHDEAAAAPSAPQPTATVAESAEPDAPPAESAVAASPSTTPSAAGAERKPRAGKPRCNPPYIVDAQGTKHLIKACL